VKGLKYTKEGNPEYSDDDDDHIETIDLTKTFQDILWKYHRFFGCKSI